MFYKDSNVVALVYDITNKDYFEDLKDYWLSKLKKIVPKETSKEKLKHINIYISNCVSRK